MAIEYSLNILIKAIDNATAPITKLQKRMAELFAPVTKLQKNLQQLGKAAGVDKLAKSIKGLQAPLKKSWQEASKLVKTFGLLGGGMLGGAVAGFKALFLNVATQNEALARSMANVTGSADAARAALAGVQASLRGWDSGDAAGAYMALKSAGLGTSEADLKKLADIAGHTGKSLTEVAGIMASLREGNAGGLAEILGGNVRQYGDYIVAEFNDAEGKLRRMAVRQTGNAAKDVLALQQMMNKAVDAKGMAGGADRFASSWQGMVQRAMSMWQRFRLLVMDSGPFNLLKEKFQDLLATFEDLEASGGLKALAEEWAKTFTEAIESLWESGKALVAWFKKDFLPAFEKVKKFFGGWSGMFKAIAAVMAGPLVLALAAATKAVLALGFAMMTTPVGWIIAGIAAVAGAVYPIYKNWSKITGWVKSIWEPVPIFFSKMWGKVKGLFADALCSITGFFTNFSLAEAGKNIVTSLLDGLKEKWEAVKAWLYGAWESLTGWLPDVIRERIGIKVDAPKPTPKPAPAGPSTGAAAIMAGGAAAGQFGGGRWPEQNVRTEVVITGENLPRGISVSAPKSQADKTRLDCGYMMAGI